jgi:pimeloyl-ACP methyl ester carboxylesterase
MRDIPMPDVLASVLSGPLFETVATQFIPDLDLRNPSQVAVTVDVLKSVLFRFGERLPGIRNDILQRDFPEIDSWPLETIPVPTLLLHGDMDENSTYQGSLHVASKVPNARLVTFEGADHNMLVTRGKEIQSHISQFIAEVMQDTAATN